MDKLLASLTDGDILTVWRLDRLGRSLPHLIEVVRDLDEKGAHFQSLTEGIDTTTAQGRPPALTSAQIKHAKKLIDGGERPAAVAASLNVDRSTLYRTMKE